MTADRFKHSHSAHELVQGRYAEHGGDVPEDLRQQMIAWGKRAERTLLAAAKEAGTPLDIPLCGDVILRVNP